MSSQPQVVQLSPLLPSPTYTLPYTLPLLLLSLVFAFAGTFLTLDRTRTFPKRGTGAVYASLPVPGSLDPPKRTSKLSWALEGGVGGLIGGYLFGVHLSTALALLIPATTKSGPLTPKSFLAIWILSSILTTPLSGRYRYAAFTLFGISGGTLTSLAICMIVHPALPSRTILTATFLILFTLFAVLLSLIPRLATRFFHAFLRVCTASTGAFGLTISIALLLNPRETSWANVWERLFVRDGDPAVWASPQERGLSAAWGLFFISGIICDWVLRRWVGECPDEKWDSYLKRYTENLPISHGERAGTFKPLTSVWDRLFPSSTASMPPTPFDFPGGAKGNGQKEMIFPSDQDSKAHLAVPFMLHNIPHAPHTPTGFTTTGMGPAGGRLSKKSKGRGDEESGLLAAKLARGISKTKKRKTSGGKGFGGIFGGGKKLNDEGVRVGRKPVKFGADLSSDSEDEDGTLAADDETKRGSLPSSPIVQHQRPGMMRDFSSAATLVERGVGGAAGRKPSELPDLKEGLPIDYEREIEMVKDKLRRNSGGISNAKGADSDVEYSDYEEDVTALKGKAYREQDAEGEWVPGFMKRHQTQSSAPPTGAMPVPATPSLIKAIDRIAIAQRDAFGGGLSTVPSRDGSTTVGHEQEPTIHVTGHVHAPRKQERAPRWEEFWREVRHKAQS